MRRTGELTVCSWAEASGRPEALSRSCDQPVVDLVRLQEIPRDDHLVRARQLQQVEQLQARQGDNDEREKGSDPRVIGRVRVQPHLYSIKVKKPKEIHCPVLEGLQLALRGLIGLIIVLLILLDFVEFFQVVGEPHDGEEVGKEGLGVF